MRAIRSAIKDPYCGLSHLVGSVLALVAMAVLLASTRVSAWHYVSFSIYGACLFALYLASGLTHSLRCKPSMDDMLERFDYAAIFALIAGTYTPLCLTALRGPVGWTLFGIEWVLAAIGVVAVMITRERPRKLTMTLYLVMGWMLVLVLGPVLRMMPAGSVPWLVAGGVCYSVGAVVFALEWPRFWPGRFGSHDVWHTLVLAGSFCHFVVMLWFIA